MSEPPELTPRFEIGEDGEWVRVPQKREIRAPNPEWTTPKED